MAWINRACTLAHRKLAIADAARRALGPRPSALPPTRLARTYRCPIPRPRHVLFTMSNSAVFFVPAARCCTRVLCRLSRFSIVGWVERQRHPSPALAGTGFDGFRARRSTHPTNSYLSFLRPGTFAPGFSLPFLPSQLPIPERGDGGAPGGGILYPVAPVTTRRHVCEAWAVPRNRDDASRRSTVTVLGPVPLCGCGVASAASVGRPSRRVLASGRPRVPNLPATVLRAAPGRHLPLRLQETLLENAPR